MLRGSQRMPHIVLRNCPFFMECHFHLDGINCHSRSKTSVWHFWNSLSGHLWWVGGNCLTFVEIYLMKVDHSCILQHSSFMSSKLQLLSDPCSESILSMRHLRQILVVHVLKQYFTSVFVLSFFYSYLYYLSERFQDSKLKYFITPKSQHITL